MTTDEIAKAMRKEARAALNDYPCSSVVHCDGDDVIAILDERAALLALLARAGEVVKAILALLAPGNRTFDEFMRDAMHADDIARALLAEIEAVKKGNANE